MSGAAPAPAKQQVDKTLAGLVHRLISDGANLADIEAVQHDLQAPGDWCRCWLAAADAHQRIGDAAMARGRTRTASEAWARAALYCHFAQGYYTDDRPEEKRVADERKQRLFQKAAPLLVPPLAPLAIPYRGIALPAYLRLPAGLAPGARPACVILIGGLDTTKEDSLALSDVLVARGLATLAFDGPGQGETFARMKLVADFESVVSAIIDTLEARPEIDARRIGVLGRATGGHFACRAAACDPRIRAAVAWALVYHVHHLASIGEVAGRFLRAAGTTSMEEAVAFYATAFDLAAFGPRIACPLMIVQGGRDPIAPPDSHTRLIAEVKGATELLYYPESGHCAHDRWHITKPAMADFLAQHLA